MITLFINNIQATEVITIEEGKEFELVAHLWNITPTFPDIIPVLSVELDVPDPGIIISIIDNGFTTAISGKFTNSMSKQIDYVDRNTNELGSRTTWEDIDSVLVGDDTDIYHYHAPSTNSVTRHFTFKTNAGEYVTYPATVTYNWTTGRNELRIRLDKPPIFINWTNTSSQAIRWTNTSGNEVNWR